jgi:hypothetical protein
LVVVPQPTYIVSRLNGSGGSSTAGPSPQIGPVTLLKGGVIEFPVSGGASNVLIQSSPNLSRWSNLSTNPVVNGQVRFSDPLFGSSSARFFKVLALP